MKRMSTLYVRDEKFEIIKHDCGKYCAINHKYLDDKMCLTQSLNGLQMFAEDTMQGCIDSATASIEIEYLMANGMTFEDAFNVYYRR